MTVRASKEQKSLADRLFPVRSEQDRPEILNVPPEQRRLHTETYDFTVATIVEFLSRDQIKIPEFQRHYVWNRSQASRLIESLIIQCPIPVIYLDQNSDNTLSVIDGNQRLLSMRLFMENSYKLTGLTAYPELDGLGYADLDPRFRSHIQTRTIRCITILKETHPQIKFDVFERLNTGAVQLLPQELRHGIYFGPLIRKIDEIASDERWLSMLGMRDDKRMRGSELALRFLALRYAADRYKKPLTGFLNDFVSANRSAAGPRLDEWAAEFRQTVAIVETLLGRRAFRLLADDLSPQRNLNAALFDAQMIAAARVKPNLGGFDAVQREQFAAAFFTLQQDREFRGYISASTSDEASVAGRIRKCEQFLRQYFV